MTFWWAGIVLSGCLVSPVMTFGGGKSQKEAQHDTLNEHFMPVTLDMPETHKGPVREARIVVYADDEYRAQNLDWQKTFGEQLEYANAVLGPEFGLHLTADYRVWDHHAPGNDLPANLDELRGVADPGHAISVIGLTSSIGLTAGTFDLLGYAEVGGRYVMLRGYADVEERKLFDKAFPKLSVEERERAHQARRVHKTTSVLLHELGHNFGANHEATDDTMMASVYSIHSTGFSDEARQIIQATIDARLGGRPEPRPVVVTGHTLHVHVMATGIEIDGKPVPDERLDGVLSQHADDPSIDVIVHKDDNVPAARADDVITRAKAMGLTRFRTE
ncbi:MAG: hypothetical protein QM831_42985 [Kofleriaceae bacterium]